MNSFQSFSAACREINDNYWDQSTVEEIATREKYAIENRGQIQGNLCLKIVQSEAASLSFSSFRSK